MATHDTLADTSTIPAKPTRRTQRHVPTTLDAVHAVVTYFNQSVAHVRAPDANPAPDTALLFTALPHGSITGASTSMTERGEVVSWRIGDRNPRLTPPEGFLIALALTLFGGFPFIDTNKKGGIEQHYVEVLADGITLQRVIAGAGDGEVAKLLGDHHDLSPWALEIRGGNPRAKRTREDAIVIALQLYRQNSKPWGLSYAISEADYEAFLRGCFRLFDAKHGKHFLRPIARPTGK